MKKKQSKLWDITSLTLCHRLCTASCLYSYVVYMYTSCEAKTSKGSLWMVLLHNYCNGLRLKIVPEGIIQGQSTGLFFRIINYCKWSLIRQKLAHTFDFIFKNICITINVVITDTLNTCWLRKLYTWNITMFEFTRQLMKCCGV